jgi:hypothetical protein
VKPSAPGAVSAQQLRETAIDVSHCAPAANAGIVWMARGWWSMVRWLQLAVAVLFLVYNPNANRQGFAEVDPALVFHNIHYANNESRNQS